MNFFFVFNDRVHNFAVDVEFSLAQFTVGRESRIFFFVLIERVNNSFELVSEILSLIFCID